MEGLFNPLSIALHMFNTALLFGVLYYLLYKPVRKYMLDRSGQIAGQLEAAEQERKEAAQLLAQAEEKRKQAMADAGQMAAQNSEQAKRQTEEIVEAARNKAQEILAAARAEADLLQKTSQEELQRQAVALALAMTEKLLAREVSAADHEKLVLGFLERSCSR